MANDHHLTVLRQGADAWNAWRAAHPDVQPDLRQASLYKARMDRMTLDGALFCEADLLQATLHGASLRGADFYRATLREADLRHADLREALFYEADLMGADLRHADLSRASIRLSKLGGAYLSEANLGEADLAGSSLAGAMLHRATLTRADLRNTELSRATLQRANLEGALLTEAILVETDLEGATLTGCSVYGISAWNLRLEGAEQSNLVITRAEEPVITVDNVKIAQFVYLLLNNRELRGVIDTITSKTVLILGRFTPERKAVLDAVRNELRNHDFVPILFDFDRPTDRDFTETIKTLAGLCLFVIADITNPRSSPLELQATVPDYKIPFVPILQEGEQPFSMFSDLSGKYPWVLQPLAYPSLDVLLQVFKPAIIDRAWEKHKELQKEKAAAIATLSAGDFLK